MGDFHTKFVILTILSYILMYMGVVVVASYLLHNVFGISSHDSKNYAIIGTIGLVIIAWVVLKKKHDDEFEKWLRNSRQ